jgi:hypothetical protein
MMDVKNVGTGGTNNITLMLVENAVAKNRELKDVMEKPIREKLPKQVSESEEPTNQSTDTHTEDNKSQPAPTTGKLVDVNV